MLKIGDLDRMHLSDAYCRGCIKDFPKFQIVRQYQSHFGDRMGYPWRPHLLSGHRLTLSGHRLAFFRHGFALLILMGSGFLWAGPRNSGKDVTELLRRLERNPLLQKMQPGVKGLTAQQKDILKKALQAMKAAELKTRLRRMKLSPSGSEYELRERLGIALGVIHPPKLPKQARIPKISIENAGDGEYIKGQDDGRGFIRFEGRIRLILPNGTVHADTVIIDIARKEIFAQGRLEYRNRSGTIRAERMIYNQNLSSGIMYNAKGYQNPVYFIGRNFMSLGPSDFALSHAYFTTCAAEKPHYNFSAKRIRIYEGKRIIAIGALYHVGGVPLLPLPFFFASRWGTGVITQMGYGNIQGFFMQNTYQFSIPEAYAYPWVPLYYRFTADFYQNTGESYGMDLFRFSPDVNYAVQIGAARYKRYEVGPDFRDGGSVRVTNEVFREDGTIGAEYYSWNKLFAIFNAKKIDSGRNHVRNIHLRYEGYTNQLYETEFGGRYQPTSTIPALYENTEAGRGLLRPQTDWNLVYNESWDDLSLRVAASRKRIWLENSNFRDSRYIPVEDIAPEAELKKRFFLGRLPGTDVSIYWDHELRSQVKKQYSGGEDFRTLNYNRYQTLLRSYVSYYPYISFRPAVGYGTQRTEPRSFQADDGALEREAKKKSYQYYYSDDELTLGPAFLFLRATYRRKDSFKEELKDSPAVNLTGFENNQKVNETEVWLESYPLPSIYFAVGSIYDQRRLLQDTGYRERWRYPMARFSYLIDFFNGYRSNRENLLTRRKISFAELRITNDYVYDHVKQRDHSNILGLNLQLAGLNIPLFKRLRYFETGFYWYHVYFNPQLDHFRYSMKADVQLSNRFFLELELESRAAEVERYASSSVDLRGQSDYRDVSNDIIDGTGLNGQTRRQKAIFNIAYFETALLIDLHEWEMRLGYSIEQRSIVTAAGAVDAVTFYDNKAFFSMTLLRFDFGGTGGRPSRFIMNRRRVRAFDTGRVPVRIGRR